MSAAAAGRELRQLRKMAADVVRLERAVDRLTVAVLDLFRASAPTGADPAAIRRARLAEGVTQVELARRMGCSQQFVSKLERGGVMTPKWVTGAAQALGVSVQRLHNTASDS